MSTCWVHFLIHFMWVEIWNLLEMLGISNQLQNMKKCMLSLLSLFLCFCVQMLGCGVHFCWMHIFSVELKIEICPLVHTYRVRTQSDGEFHTIVKHEKVKLWLMSLFLCFCVQMLGFRIQFALMTKFYLMLQIETCSKTWGIPYSCKTLKSAICLYSLFVFCVFVFKCSVVESIFCWWPFF
jgi:hypothetical protein